MKRCRIRRTCCFLSAEHGSGLDETFCFLAEGMVAKDPYAVEYEEATGCQMMITASREVRLYTKAVADDRPDCIRNSRSCAARCWSHYEKGDHESFAVAIWEKSQFYSYYKCSVFEQHPAQRSDWYGSTRRKSLTIRHFPSDRPRKSAFFNRSTFPAAISNATADKFSAEWQQQAEKA